jgi:hypothetical protein
MKRRDAHSGAAPNGRWNATGPRLAASLCAALLIAQGARATSPSCEARALADHEALRAQDLGSWEPLDDHTLLIWAKGAMRAHLVRLATPLAGLSEAPIIMLLDGDGDQLISPCGHDAATLPGGHGETARITSMELLSVKRTAELDRPDPTIAEALRRI